jgi:hypothetical protein
MERDADVFVEESDAMDVSEMVMVVRLELAHTVVDVATTPP